MANDGRINIIITEGDMPSGGGGQGSGGKGTTDSSSTNKITKFDRYIAHRTIHALESEAKKIINHQISTYGLRTGDYITQNNVQQSINLAFKAISIGTSAWTGFKASGGSPIGAAVGAGVGLALNITNTVFEFIDFDRKIRYQNSNINLLRERSGLNSLNDGSRGTEN